MRGNKSINVPRWAVQAAIECQAVWADPENDLWRQELVRALRQADASCRECGCNEERKLALLNALRMVYLESNQDRLEVLLQEVVNRALLVGWAPDLIEQINSALQSAPMVNLREN